MDNLDIYLATVDELVDDENKLVTYKHISQHLALPISRAKLILENYAKTKKRGSISVVYSLVGKVSKGVQVSLVRDDDLELAKSHLDAVISCHAYSVQKAKLKDPNPLYTADYDMTRANLFKCGGYSAVKYSGAKSLTDDEMKMLRSSMMKTSVSVSTSTFNKPVSNQTKKTAPQKGISSMFASKPTKVSPPGKLSTKSGENTNLSKGQEAATDTTQCGKGGIIDQSNKQSSAKHHPGKKAGMGAFVTKGKQDLFAAKTKASPPKQEATPPKPAPPNIFDESDEEMVIDPVDSPSSKVVAKPDLLDELQEETIKKEVNKTTTKSKNKPKPKKPRTNSGDLPAKKRRRIQEMSSSSGEESEDDYNEDVIPPSPIPVMAKSSSVIKVGPKNARKKRVLKSHTYVDKDGSMLTEKRYEEVSCSSDDETPNPEIIKPQDVALESKSKTSPNVTKPVAKKNKQASIMGFLSKKSAS